MNQFGAPEHPHAQQPPVPGQWGATGTNPPMNYGAPVTRPIGFARASFGQRFGGLLIDSIVVGFVTLIFSVPLFIVGINGSETERTACTDVDGTSSTCTVPTSDTIVLWFVLFGLYFLVAMVVTFFLHIRPIYRTGQTIGRRIVGTKVVDINDGSLLSGGRAFGRYLFANFISGNIMYLGYLWMLWDDEKQTLHDKVTSSTVIQT